MRCFIAIDIDRESKRALAELVEKLRAEADISKSDAKWVDPEAMHLTLKFLGETKDQQLADVFGAVEATAAAHGSFELEIASTGSFGGRTARVLWAGTGRGSEELLALQADLEERLAAAGWPKEQRAYSGHLTLCRIRNPKAGAVLKQAAENHKDFKAGTVAVDRITVYQSQLTPNGPIYTALASYELK